MRIFILGANGMIGSTLFRFFLLQESLDVYGLVRSKFVRENLKLFKNILISGDLTDTNNLTDLIKEYKPLVIINCAGITKHLKECKDNVKAIQINSLLPHKIVNICKNSDTKIIQISTDCTFSGSKGNYTEKDVPDSFDIYGKSKYLGEILDKPHLTIRTSTIGHEMNTKHGLLEWFLVQNKCMGYKNAIFSGITTLELAKVIYKILRYHKNLSGLYHISSKPIDKYSLLKMISIIYKHTIELTPSLDFRIDRSLNSNRFSLATDYISPPWEEMISSMYKFQEKTNV